MEVRTKEDNYGKYPKAWRKLSNNGIPPHKSKITSNSVIAVYIM